MLATPSTPHRQRTVRANTLDLAIVDYDPPTPEARPLVIVHGIGSRAASWWPVADALAARFHLLALDLRGHGASAKPAVGYLLADYAADLAAVIDALEVERPLILGHSLGALTALHWAVDHPTRAAALALEDPSLRTQPEILQAFDGWIALNAMPPEHAAAWYKREHPEWTDEECRYRAGSITSTAPQVFIELRADSEVNLEANTDRLALLDAIRSPTLLVRGDPEAGSMVVPADAERFAATLPNARVERVPGAGHTIHRDFPDAFLALVVPFLEAAA